MKTIQIQDVTIGPEAPLAVIAGPCVLESYDLCMTVGSAVRDCCAELGLGFIFKASYDKANRSSIKSRRGPGAEEGLAALARVGSELGVPVTTDVHEPGQAAAAGQAVDLLQIPAFLCRQTDLLVAAAQTGKAVNVKKGQFLSPDEMGSVVGKLTEGGADAAGIMLTERGTFFGYNRLVNDFIGLGDMMELGWPVCFDVTHSTQLPGGASAGAARITGGRPERAGLLARAAVAAGVQAVFIETHPDPAAAHSDAATMQPLDATLALLPTLARLRDSLQ
jgi:2-dehydro-3-deoxyphosphooctonate aldolase (KDO 8-P synthase)